MSTIGERIKIIRTNNKDSQHEFASKIGISQTHISKIESGKENPSESVLKLISLQYKVSYEWICKGTGAYSIDNNYDYFERGYEKEHKKVMLQTIKDFLDVLDDINAASIYLAIGAITSEFKDVLLQVSQSKNAQILLADLIAHPVLNIIDSVLVSEKNLNDSSSIDLHYIRLLSEIHDDILQIKKYQIEKLQKSEEKTDND